MVGVIDVKVQSHNPNFPLEPVFTFINSAQSFRIRNVPRAVGKWNITNVFVHLTYPDNTTVQKECVLNGNIWIGTVEGCAESGTSTNGFIVTASGIDENENVITNYVLGAGDLYVKDLDGTIDPERVGTKMYFNDALPINPKKGDATFIDGVLNVYDGTNWVPVAESPDPSFIIDADGNKIYADRTVEIVEHGEPHWALTNGTNTYTLTGTQTNASWSDGNTKYILIYSGLEWTLTEKYTMPGLPVMVTRWQEYIDGSTSDTELTFPTHDFTATWNDARTVTEDELALKSDLPTKTSDLTNDSGFITSADVPTKTSDLTNDSGFITAAQIPTPSYIEDADGNRINANFSAKKSTAHKTWYVTDTRHGGNKYSLTPIDNFLSAEFFPDTPVEEESYGFRIQLVQNGDNYTGTFYDYFYVNSVWEENEAWEVEFLNGETSVQCDQYFVEYSNILTDVTIATANDLPTKTSDLSNDSGFITSAEIEPYHDSLTPTVNTGVANKAASIALRYTVNNKLIPDSILEGTVSTNLDLTDKFKATMVYATYYPYNLEKYFEQTFSPALELKFCEGKIAYLAGSRPRTIYTGYMFRTGGAGFAMPCSEDGTPDGRLYETTEVKPAAVIIANQTTSLHQLTFTQIYNDPYGQVAAVDGQSGQMTCRRTNAYKLYSISEELANKSDLPTKTSDLTNDSGFITSADIITKRDLSDMTVKGVPQNTNTQSWFNISYGTTTQNARYYDEGRWESGQTVKVLATSTSWVFELQKLIESQWLSLGTFSLDNNSEATITYDGVTYSITGYVGEIVTSNQLTSQIAALEARIAALENN